MSGEGTFFKIDRKIFDSDIWLQPVELRLFIYLIGKARHSKEPSTKYKNKGVIINRGQFLRSYRKLRDDLEYMENNSIKNYSLSRIKTAIDRLEEQGRIKTENTQLGTLFTICNYATYQGSYKNNKRGQNEEKTASERSKNGVRTESERSENNTKNVKNDNNVKNDKESNNMWPAKSSLNRKSNGHIDYPDKFEKVWSEYPNRNGNNPKGGAYQKVRARIKEGVDYKYLLEATKNYKKFIKNKDKTGTEYVMMTKTFFGPQDNWVEFKDYIFKEDKNARTKQKQISRDDREKKKGEPGEKEEYNPVSYG